MYRVLENMYSNISKYAMENTRVYIDVIPNNNRITIQMKNIPVIRKNTGFSQPLPVRIKKRKTILQIWIMVQMI